jgi:hypothetical protein
MRAYGGVLSGCGRHLADQARLRRLIVLSYLDDAQEHPVPHRQDIADAVGAGVTAEVSDVERAGRDQFQVVVDYGRGDLGGESAAHPLKFVAVSPFLTKVFESQEKSDVFAWLRLERMLAAELRSMTKTFGDPVVVTGRVERGEEVELRENALHVLRRHGDRYVGDVEAHWLHPSERTSPVGLAHEAGGRRA